MKNISVFLTMVFTITFTHGQNPPIDWAKSIGGTDDDRANCIAADAADNSIIAGRFRSPSINLGHTTLVNSDTSGNAADIFIIKLQSNGNILWAKSAGGKRDDHATKCQTDRNGNIVVVGWFESTLTFQKTVLTRNYVKGSDFFIAKFSPFGDCIWAINAGGEGSAGDYSSCSVDKNNDIIVSGIFDCPVMDFGDFKLFNSGESDMFIAKYSADGKILWAKNAMGSNKDEGQSCSTDSEGNILVGGYFASPSLTFDSITIKNSGEKSGDAFVAKYSADGKILWAKSIGGSSTEIGNCIADSYGNVIVSGFFTSSTITFGSTTLVNSGAGDIFVIKFDPLGNVLWAKSAGGSSFDAVRSFCSDNRGNIFITGSFFSPEIAFGTDTIKNKTDKSEDIFIAQFNANGDMQWAESAGGNGRNCGRGIAANSSGNIYLTGSFEESALEFGTETLKNTGSADIFIVKYREIK